MNPGIQFSINPVTVVKEFWKYRTLIFQMTKREVVGRYKGSMLGMAWSFFNPLMMLAVYTFVFSVVFKARWNTDQDSKAAFALALFIGLIVHGLLSDCVNRAPGLILNNVGYVKKVVFPLEILPWVVMGGAIFNALISLSVWSLFYIIIYQSFHWTVVFAPLIFLPLILFTMGIFWFLSSVGVFLRDIGQLTGVITTILLFLSPVFYPVSMLPESYRAIIYLNPLTFFIEQARKVFMLGQAPDWIDLTVSFVISLGVAWLGFVWFQKTRRGFADVL